jgi:hypothetical protein
MLLQHKRENVQTDAECPLTHLLLPIWVAAKANIQLDASGGSMLRLDKRRALEYPAGGTKGL